jgi:hypothetical protein
MLPFLQFHFNHFFNSLSHYSDVDTVIFIQYRQTAHVLIHVVNQAISDLKNNIPFLNDKHN